MKRGQLTYYFPTKEDILLAVFDRLLFLMYHRMEAVDGTREERLQNHSAWECVQRLLKMILHPAHPDDLDGEFHALQYTFLAQIAHREDFRQRLASLYEEWRSGMAGHWHETAVPELPLVRAATPRILASFVQALVHGLLVQLSADPEAFDREEMLAFCIGVLAPLFVSPTSSPRPRRNGHPCRAQEDSRD